MGLGHYLRVINPKNSYWEGFQGTFFLGFIMPEFIVCLELIQEASVFEYIQGA